MALPRVRVATTADPQTRPLIRFDARAALLEKALGRTRVASSVSGGMLEFPITVENLNAPGIASMRREVNKLLKNAAASIRDAVVQKNRQIGYDTGLMASSWKERVTMADASDTFTIELTNPTPYAAVAKRAGSDWYAGRTMLEYHIRPLVRRLAGRMAKDLRATLASMLARRAARASA